MIQPTKKNIIIGISVVVLIIILLVFGALTIYWFTSGSDDSEFQDLVDLANSKL